MEPSHKKRQREDILAGLKQGTLLGFAALALILPPAVTSYPATPRGATSPVAAPVHTAALRNPAPPHGPAIPTRQPARLVPLAAP